MTLNFGSVVLMTMARPLRIDFEGGVYHVTARGWERRAVVRDDEDRANWVRLTDRVALRFGWRVFAWALMRNHWHFFLSTPEPNLSRGMHDLNAGYATMFNRRHRRSGALLQGPTARRSLDSSTQDHAPVPERAFRRQTPEVRAVCGNSARTDLCGGTPARAFPTATLDSVAGTAPLTFRGRLVKSTDGGHSGRCRSLMGGQAQPPATADAEPWRHRDSFVHVGRAPRGG